MGLASPRYEDDALFVLLLAHASTVRPLTMHKFYRYIGDEDDLLLRE